MSLSAASGRLCILLLCALLVACTLNVTVTPSQGDPVDALPELIKACPEQAERKSIVACNALYKDVYGAEARALYMFRKRLNEFMDNTAAGAESAYFWLMASIAVTAFLSLAAALFPFFPNRWKRLATITKIVGVILAFAISIFSAFNFAGQYKAELSAYRSLSGLRDQIDTITLNRYVALKRGEEIAIVDDKLLTEWTTTFSTILTNHAEALAGSLGAFKPI